MLNKFQEVYYKIFSIKEIEESQVLQLLFYVLSFSFFATFNSWINNVNVNVSNFVSGGHICPPYFLTCGQYFFLEGLPYGYSLEFFYIFLYVLLLSGVYFALRGRWVLAHGVILVCLLWKIIYGFLFTYGALGNFDYYDMILAIIWLFAIHKVYFASVSFIYFYFLASSIKIHEGWILGNYFKALYTGAPIFSDKYIAVFTNFVIIMQMVSIFFLFSKNKFLYWFSFVYFLMFHVYSGVLVHYRYITVSLPALFVLFGWGRDFGKTQNLDFKILGINKKTFFGYGILLLITFGQLVAISIPGDQKKTLEGNYWGLYMFEANHQCYSNGTVYYTNSTSTKTIFHKNHIANNRCDLYRYYFQLKTICDRDLDVERISWQFDHSINGHPYERIVNVEDVCVLDYQTFKHNSWIKIDEDKPEIMQFPVYKTGYLDPLLPETQVPTNPTVNPMLVEILSKVYWFVWALVVTTLFWLVFKKTFIK